MSEIVRTRAEAVGRASAPLLVLEAVERFLDEHGLGAGTVRATRIGEGQSNVTFLLERGGARLVLRRPPPPPLPPSAHDVVREARLKIALRGAGAPVPEVAAVCEDERVIGAPFYVMPFVDGEIVTSRLPEALAEPAARAEVGTAVVEALVAVHAVDWKAAGIPATAPDGYVERQIRRFSALWPLNATRDLPAVRELAGRLERTRPASPRATVVHGDYRLGNLILSSQAPLRVEAILDWELATVGDPLADLGYLVATWDESGAPTTPLSLSPLTRLPGFAGRRELAEAYGERTGLDLTQLPWYEALALWKAAVFCEAIYGRYLRGERGDDAFGASLEDGVPQLLEGASVALDRLVPTST